MAKVVKKTRICKKNHLKMAILFCERAFGAPVLGMKVRWNSSEKTQGDTVEPLL